MTTERFVGVDLHKKSCVFTELDSKGKILRRGKFGNNIGEVSAFAASLHPGTKLVVEPLLNYLWFLDQVAPYVKSVHPANPHRVRIIAEAKCKTDRYDSYILAELLRTDFLPESHYVPARIRELKDIVRQRLHLVGHNTALKNRMRHLVFLNSSVVGARNITSPKAQREIKRLHLSESIRASVEQCQRVILGIEPLLEELDREIEVRCSGIKEIEILMSVYGIGPLWAAVIYTEVVDISRFRSRKALISYAGLAPSVRASGDKVSSGGITHQGSSLLRTALVEAGMNAKKVCPELRRLYQRVFYKKGKETARVAVARKMAVIIFALLREKRAFRL